MTLLSLGWRLWSAAWFYHWLSDAPGSPAIPRSDLTTAGRIARLQGRL